MGGLRAGDRVWVWEAESWAEANVVAHMDGGRVRVRGQGGREMTAKADQVCADPPRTMRLTFPDLPRTPTTWRPKRNGGHRGASSRRRPVRRPHLSPSAWCQVFAAAAVGQDSPDSLAALPSVNLPSTLHALRLRFNAGSMCTSAGRVVVAFASGVEGHRMGQHSLLSNSYGSQQRYATPSPA